MNAVSALREVMIAGGGFGDVARDLAALAAFGEGDQWVVDQMTAYFAANPIQAGGKSYGVEIIIDEATARALAAATPGIDELRQEGAEMVLRTKY